MKADFKLSERLRLYLRVASGYPFMTLGEKYPVSIRRRYRWSQTLVIYPDSDFPFFMHSEVMCFLSLAKGLDLDSSISVENGLPVIEITEWFNNDK